MARSGVLQDFLDAAFVAYDRFAKDPEGRRSLARIVERLKTPGPERPGIGKRLAVCDAHLDTVLAAGTGEPLLDTLAGLQGKFLLSSYPSDILAEYAQRYGWHTQQIQQRVSVNKGSGGGKMKIEQLTANYPI